MLKVLDLWRASSGPLGEPSKTDFTKVKAAGVVGVYLRRTHGNDGIDGHGEEDEYNARKAGLIVGNFHMAYPDSSTDAETEAKHFLSKCSYRKGDFVPALDIENNRNNLPDDDVAKWSLTFLNVVADATGVVPAWYTGKWFIDSDMSSRYLLGLGRFLFWPSVWSGAEDGSFWPSVWGRPADIWQRRYPSGPGVVGHVDGVYGGHGVNYIRDAAGLDRLRGMVKPTPGTYKGRMTIGV